jgi:HEAT repeat protein
MSGRIALFLALVAVIGFVSGPAPLRADEAKDQIEAFHAQMKEADDAGKVKLIGEFQKTENEGRGKAIMKYLSSRSTAVKVAAINALGAIKNPKDLGKLMGMSKAAEKEPQVLAALVRAIGEFGEKKSRKILMDTAKKWLFKDAAVAAAAARGLGHIPDRGSVEDLIKLLAMTYPSQGQGGQISSETTAMLKAARPGIIEGLQVLTGWDFEDEKAWNNFWEREKKRWKPGGLETDLTKLMKWEDPGYGFVVDKPNEKWIFDRSGDYTAYRIYMARINDKVTEGYVYIQAYTTTGLTPEQKATSFEDNYRGSWKDIKEESVVREAVKLGKTKGFMHSFTGLDTYGAVAKVKNTFYIHNEIMFVVGSWRRTGLAGIDEEVDKALKSFRFLYE